MKVKFANKIYEVLYTMKFLGKPIYAVEDEPNHIDWLVNVEVIDEEEESEDERIRKELIDYIKSKFENSCSPTPSKNILGNWIAWLEKQNRDDKKWIYEDVYIKDANWLKSIKERVQSKQNEQKPIWDKFDDLMLKDALEFIETGWSDNGKSHLIYWLKSIKDKFK